MRQYSQYLTLFISQESLASKLDAAHSKSMKRLSEQLKVCEFFSDITAGSNLEPVLYVQ
jgi:hypothetical protein